MLLDLWSLVLIISDLVGHLKDLVEHGSFSFSIFIFLTIVGFVLYLAWQSTDIPDLPPPPHPPYVIQIQANVNAVNSGGGIVAPGFGGRHTLSDVRLLSSGPLVESVLNRLPPRQHHQVQHHQHTHGHRSALFFGLLRRPSPRPLLHFRPTTRSRFQASNVIVYSQVNVYHSNSSRQGPPAGVTTAREVGSVTSSGTVSEGPDQGRTEGLPSNSTDSGNPNGENNRSNENIISNSIEVSNPVGSGISLRRLSETNPNDLDVDTDESTVDVDVVEVDVNDLNVSEGRQVGVDVDLNGDVTIVERNVSSSSSSSPPSSASNSATSANTNVQFDGVNVNVNSSVVTMKTNRTGAGDNSNDGGGKASDSGGGSTTTHVHHQSPPNPVETEGDVRITLKFLNETQMEVTTQLSEKIADFKRRHFATELSENKVIRLIFNGRVLDNDGKTLQESGIFDQCVVHCLIVTPQNSGHHRGNQTGQSQMGQSEQNARGGRSLRDGPEPGMFFVSVLGIVLIFLWFICFHFGQLFTQSAVISLVVLTAVFVIGLVALYLPVQSNN